MKEIVENWSQGILLMSEVRKKVIKSMVPYAKNTDVLPNDLGLYEIKDLEVTDINNNFNGAIRGSYINEKEVGFFSGVITPEIIMNKRPLFIMLEVIEEEREFEEKIKKKLILKCSNFLEKLYEEAKQMAFSKAKAELT